MVKDYVYKQKIYHKNPTRPHNCKPDMDIVDRWGCYGNIPTCCLSITTDGRGKGQNHQETVMIYSIIRLLALSPHVCLFNQSL